LPSWVDDVVGDHPAGHVIRDVTVDWPRPRIVFHQLEGRVGSRPEKDVVGELTAAVDPSVAMDVPRMEFAPDADYSPSRELSDLAAEGGDGLLVGFAYED